MAGGLRIADAPAISQLEGTDKLPVSVGDNEAHSVEADKIKGFVNGSELDGSTVLGRIKNLETNLANEIQTRTEADTSLGDHKADKSYVDAELLAEANEREQQDIALHHEIDDEAMARGNADTTLQQNIDNEALARQNADGTLQQAINDERDARILAVGDEATARGNADDTLQGNIDAEATTRGNADLNLQHNINEKAAILHDADVTLQGNIDAERQARILADNAEQLARQNADDALNTAKANKNEMSVTNGTGANADKVTIQLKSGTSATVLKTHQDISGKADKDTDAVQGDVAVFDANGNPVDSGSAIEETPTESSNNLAKSGGVWSWVTGLLSSLREWARSIFAAKDGYYSTLTAGAAENLVRPSVDSDTYLIRPTGGAENEVANGVASVLGMEGNSAVWNQLSKIPTTSKTTTQNGVTITDNRDGSYTISTVNTGATANTYVTLISSVDKLGIAGHKYLLTGIRGGSGSTYRFANVSTDGSGFTSCYNPIIFNAQNIIGLSIYVYANAVITTPVVVRPQLIDLTLLGIDNLTTVAQVEEWLAQHVGTKPYYAYNAGTILSAQTLGIKTYGQNLLNPTTKQAKLIPYTWVENGTTYSNQYTIKNVPSGATATFTPDNTGVTETVDISGGSLDITSYGSGILELSAATANTYVCIKWNGTKDDDVVPYEDHTYDFDVRKVYGKVSGAGEYVQCFPDGMRSAGSVHDTLTASDAVSAIGSRAYQSGDESDSSVITDRTNTLYALSTPITYTDLIYRDGGIDRPLADVLMNITVNNWSMEEQLMTPYDDGNPTSIPATIKTQYSMDAVETIDTLQKTTYTESKVHDNLAAMLSCINTNCAETLGGTFNVSDTATDKVFEFTFTPNVEPTNEGE